MFVVVVLLPSQEGGVEGLKVLRGVRVAEEPVKGCPDEQAAEEGAVGVVGFGEEKLFSTREGLGIELLQRRVCGDQSILQGSGTKAELLSMSALQHC